MAGLLYKYGIVQLGGRAREDWDSVENKVGGYLGINMIFKLQDIEEHETKKDQMEIKA